MISFLESLNIYDAYSRKSVRLREKLIPIADDLATIS